MTPERRALFLAGAHCQGGHSEAGQAIATVLGVNFPLTMTDLIAQVRREGENPAAYYRWLIPSHGSAKHRFFTQAEIANAEGKAPQ